VFKSDNKISLQDHKLDLKKYTGRNYKILPCNAGTRMKWSKNKNADPSPGCLCVARCSASCPLYTMCRPSSRLLLVVQTKVLKSVPCCRQPTCSLKIWGQGTRVKLPFAWSYSTLARSATLEKFTDEKTEENLVFRIHLHAEQNHQQP